MKRKYKFNVGVEPSWQAKYEQLKLETDKLNSDYIQYRAQSRSESQHLQNRVSYLEAANEKHKGILEAALSLAKSMVRVSE